MPQDPIIVDPQDVIEEVESSRIIGKRATRPKKPTLKTPKQEFKKPLPPSIPAQIQESKFKFETGTFRETPEEFMLRSADPTILSPQDKLKQARFLADKSRKPLVSVRAETPLEQRQSQAIDWLESLTPEQTTIYNIYQKGLGAVGDVSLAMGRGTAESFSSLTGIDTSGVGRWIEQAKKERDIDRPPIDISSIASDKLSAPGKALGYLSKIGGSVTPLVALGKAGMSVGAPTTLTSGVGGALAGIGSTAEETDHVGMSKDRRDIALLMGGLSGATEAFGLERVLDKFGLGAPFRKAILGVGMEGGQGGVQRFLDNINAIYVGGWDPNRGVMDQVALSALEETIGAAMVMGTASIAEARQRASGKSVRSSVGFDADVARADQNQVGLVPGGFFSPPRPDVDGAIPSTVAISAAPYPPRMGGASEDMNFYLLPGLQPGQAPVMISPGWVIESATGTPTSTGVNIPLDRVPRLKNTLIANAPSKQHLSEALFQIEELVRETKAEGLNTISLARGGTSKDVQTKSVSHETFHAGQEMIGPDKWTVHDAEWAKNHPDIREVVDRNPNLRAQIAVPGNLRPIEDILATEMPTYVAAGQGDHYFESPTRAVDFSYEYYKHIAERHGSNALTILETTAKLPPESLEVLRSARSTYESYERELAAQSGTISKGTGQQYSDVRGVPGVAEAGIAGRRDQEEVGRTTPTTSRSTALEHFYRNSAVKVPLYHGTSSPTEIVRIDPSKFDPDAKYGPGFYMTQSSEVAAGEEGSYVNKTSKPTPEEYNQRREAFYQEEADRIGFKVPPGKEAMDSLYRKKRLLDKFIEGPDDKLLDDLDSAVGNAMRRTDEWERERMEGQPHAYQLYANIEKPFDIEAQYDKWEAGRILGGPASAGSGQDIYNQLVDIKDGKVGANDALQKAGYDGITHIGGRGKRTSFGLDEDAAINHALEVGGKLVKIPLRINTFRGVNKTNYFIERPDGTTPFLEGGWPKDFGSVEAAQKYLDELPYGPYDNAVEGHKVWIAFPNAQVKSATGNIGTFDPQQEGIALSKKDPPLKIGDEVRSKSRGQEGTITKMGSDDNGPWAEVKFQDGSTEELNLSDLVTTKVTQVTKQTTQAVTPSTEKVTKKGRVPTLPGPMRIRGERVAVNRMGPGSTPGIVRIEFNDGTKAEFPLKDVKDSSGRRIKDPLVYMLTEDPPQPPQPPPIRRNPSLPEEGGGPIFQARVVRVLHSRALAKKFDELLETHQITYDFWKDPSVQVWEAVADGRLRDDEVGRILEEEGIPWEDFSEDVFRTYSEAGQTLQPLSEIVQRHWRRLRDENPALFDKLVPPSRKIQLILDDMNSTVLGMSLWRRTGRLFQKAALTQYSTAVVNFTTATGRVPLDAGATALGQTIFHIVEGRREGKSWETVMKDASVAAYETFVSGFEAWRALNPMQMKEVLKFKGLQGKEYTEYKEVVTQLEKYFPDIHSKLFAKPMEMGSVATKEGKGLVKEAEDNVKSMRILLPKIKNDSKRRDFQQKIKKLEKKIRSEKKGLGKIVYRGPEYIYDQFLRPMQFGEFLLRRPRFVMRLGQELRDRGIDLKDIMNGKGPMEFKDIPPEAMKAAVNDALEFTMALDPKTGEDARISEQIGGGFIKLMNAMGPLLPLTDAMFARALYSSAKTFYDYSPAPFIFEWGEGSSFGRLFRGKDDIDPKTGESYRTNPASREDTNRLGKAITGTFLMILIYNMIKEGLIGEEWYQWFPRKDKNGKQIFTDIRRYPPFSRIAQLTSLVERYFNGRTKDVQAGKELTDIVTGIKQYETDPDAVTSIDAIAEYWSGPNDNPFKVEKANQWMIGRPVGMLLTPFMNLRSIVAAYDEDENVRKDLRGYGMWGPALDKLPWARRSMPNLTQPTFSGDLKISESPILQQFGGVQNVSSPGFMGREFQRMGVNVRKYFAKDPDPIIDREQNRAFNALIKMYEDTLQNDPSYIQASDVGKMTKWEDALLGDNGIVAFAREQGLNANPTEALRRAIEGDYPGRFTREFLGIDKIIKGLEDRNK